MHPREIDNTRTKRWAEEESRKKKLRREQKNKIEGLVTDLLDKAYLMPIAPEDPVDQIQMNVE
jgi:hypothetical protein